MNRPVVVDDFCRAIHHVPFLTEIEGQDGSGSYLKGDGVAVDFTFLDRELMGRITDGASQFRAVSFRVMDMGIVGSLPPFPTSTLPTQVPVTSAAAAANANAITLIKILCILSPCDKSSH